MTLSRSPLTVDNYLTEMTNSSFHNPSLPAHLYTEKYFREACEGCDEFSASQGDLLSHRLEMAIAVADVTPGMRVLDVGCGRGEILLHCARMGAAAYGVDYAPVAVAISRGVIAGTTRLSLGVTQADAKQLPFPDQHFDRVLMFDVLEHLYPWEIQAATLEVMRVLRDDGALVAHTAPNAWYDRFTYPLVRAFRRLTGDGANYPANPRALNVDANVDVHVNEQSALSLWRALRKSGFRSRVWLHSPPQNRKESRMLAMLRHVLFHWVPFRWFFEREVFAIARKRI